MEEGDIKMEDLILCDVYAKDLRGLLSKSLSKEEESKITTNIVLSKFVSEINYQILGSNMKGKTCTDYSLNENMFPDDGVLSILMEMLTMHFGQHGFEVCHHGNVISLDWSENGPYGELNDDFEDGRYDGIEQFYENIHKQKTKKQHAPRKHNLKVIK